MLLIDDLGTENTTEFSKEFLYNLVNERYNYCLPLIITTNLRAQELQELYSQRLVSRLAGMCHTVVLNGEDLRVNNKKF